MDEKIETEESIKRWDRFADTYASFHKEEGDTHKKVLLNPSLFKLMGNVKGLRVLDAGCGEGYLSRLLAAAGANVSSVDYSSRMIEISKERTPVELGISFYQGNCERMDFFDDERFELIVSNMVVQDLANYEEMFKEVFRVLKRDGMFIFSILHPCFVTPESGWERDENGQKRHWNVDRYFYEGVYEQALGEDEKMVFFHRTLTTYITTLLKIGFSLEAIDEPKPSKEILKTYPSFEEDLRCADFIIFKIKK